MTYIETSAILHQRQLLRSAVASNYSGRYLSPVGKNIHGIIYQKSSGGDQQHIHAQNHKEQRSRRRPVRCPEKFNEGKSREKRSKNFLYHRFLPRSPVPLPLIDIVVVRAGGSFIAPDGGISSEFCDRRGCSVGGRSTEFVLPVPGALVDNYTGVALLASGTAGA